MDCMHFAMCKMPKGS